MSSKLVFQACSFCDQEFENPSIFISNYNEVWICRNCDNLMFPKNIMENDDCSACLKNTHVLKIRNCIHKLCSECFKKTNFGSTIHPKQWEDLEMKTELPEWPFEIKKEDDSDPEYIKRQEYQQFFITNFNNEKATYDELIEIRNNLISTRPAWMNIQIIINFENQHFKYITELFKTVNGLDDYKKAKDGAFCPLCRENNI